MPARTPPTLLLPLLLPHIIHAPPHRITDCAQDLPIPTLPAVACCPLHYPGATMLLPACLYLPPNTTTHRGIYYTPSYPLRVIILLYLVFLWNFRMMMDFYFVQQRLLPFAFTCSYYA